MGCWLVYGSNALLQLGALDGFLGFVEVKLEVGTFIGVGIFVVPFPNVAGKYLRIGNGKEAYVDELCRHGRCS